MTREAFAARWAAALGPARWRADAPLAPLTTFHVGGLAEWLAEVSRVDQLEGLIADAAAAAIPVTILGGGSNVLVSDAGVAGVVVRVRLTSITQPADEVVRAEAGVTMNGLVRWTIGRGLSGLEAWAGTPGTVGGAIHGNAHWGGSNIGELVRSVLLIDRSGTSSMVPAVDMEFGYDTSRLKRTGEVLAWADLTVGAGDVALLRQRARASLQYRKETQPLAMPSAGCVFQNPSIDDVVPAGIPRLAGALVDRAGLKGYRIGGACISDRHGNFFVNDDGASAADIRALVEQARTAVRDKFGVELRDEIVYLGTFGHG